MSKDWAEPYPEEIQVKITTKTLEKKIEKLKTQLKEANTALKLYADSKIGEEQEDGTYLFRYQVAFGGDGNGLPRFENRFFVFDPRPAKNYIRKWKVKFAKKEDKK